MEQAGPKHSDAVGSCWEDWAAASPVHFVGLQHNVNKIQIRQQPDAAANPERRLAF